MKMQINFYSKDEVSIQMEFDSQLMPEGEESELFMFACFILRQFHNLGHNVSSDTCAGLFLSESDSTSTFEHWDAEDESGSRQRPSAALCLARVLKYKLISSGRDDKEAEIESFGAIFKYSQDKEVQFVDDQLLGKLPKLVNSKGQGSKRFTTTWLPFQSHEKGFGFLGINVVYFACHSIIASYRFLSQKHTGDPTFLNHLYNTAMACSAAHIRSAIPLDQPTLASAILSRLGYIK